MAVKASATITLTQYRDTQSVTRYYKLQPAGSSAPLKPETKPPSSDWTDSEPACDISKELYFCDLTIFSNGEGEYSKVSKSTSYEAAKQAYNRADNAQKSIDNLEIGGRNLLLNSGFKNNADEWFTYGITDYIVKDGKQCAHINFSVFKVTNFVLQSILGKIEPDTQYTMSGWVLTENVVIGTTNFAWMFYHDGYYDNNGSSEWYSYGSKHLPINAGEWTHLEWTFTTDSTKLSSSTVSDMYLYARDMTGDIYFCDLKLEKGNKATDWTPAPEDVDAGIANAQTGVDSLNDTVFGVQTFNYILDGVTIPAHKREDGTYYYILNDEEVTVAEADLVHDADGELISYQDGGIYEDLDNIAGNIEAINTKVNGFDAREDAIYASIEQNSLIARNYARFNEQSLIITNESETKKVEDLNNYLQLNSDSIIIHSNKNPAVAIGVIDDTSGNKSGYMEMKGTSLFIAQESRLSTIRLRSVEKIGKLALVAGSDGHVSLREVLD